MKRLVFVCVSIMMLTGCFTTNYYSAKQTIGQTEVQNHRFVQGLIHATGPISSKDECDGGGLAGAQTEITAVNGLLGVLVQAAIQTAIAVPLYYQTKDTGESYNHWRFKSAEGLSANAIPQVWSPSTITVKCTAP